MQDNLETSWLAEALGITLLPPVSEERVEALMEVDSRTIQPFGFLSGGASLALAETVAGYGSHLLLPDDMKPVGGNVTANHVSSVAKGGRVRAVATILHRGRTTHLWNVDITDEATGRLVSAARVLNHIIPVSRLAAKA